MAKIRLIEKEKDRSDELLPFFLLEGTSTELEDNGRVTPPKFDEIVEKYGLEKIKTIGDSYLYAGGLRVATEYHVKKNEGK